MKKITFLLVALIATLTFQMQAQGTEIILTQSVGQDFSNESVSCYGGDNSWFREYVLSDEGITNEVKVVGVEFALEKIESDEELKIYAYDFEGFPVGFDSENPPAPIASGGIIVGKKDYGIIFRVDFDIPVLVSAGSSIVVSVVQPTFSGNPINLATTVNETKESFIIAKNCDVFGEPLPVSAIGFPQSRHIINLVVSDQTLSITNNLIDTISIFPNPTQGNLNFRMPAHIEVLKVQMFDVLGKNIKVTYQNKTVNTSILSPGVYILKVKTSQGDITKKIVKQ